MTEDYPSIVGTCKSMCPQTEVDRRHFEGRVHILEKTMPDGDFTIMVKEYRRSAAGRELCKADELRPLEVLEETMEYLIRKILWRNDIKCEELHSFVEDRIRSILQDMTIQRLCCVRSIGILRLCFHYFIYSEYWLRHSSQSSHITASLAQQCACLLVHRYPQHYNNVVDMAPWPEAASFQENWAEFAACYLIHNLGLLEAGYYILSLPPEIRYHDIVQLSWRVYIAHIHNNYVQFFRLVQQLPHLLECAVHRHFTTCRRNALKVMCVACSSRTSRFLLSNLSKVLALNSTENASSFCAFHGIQTEEAYALLTESTFTENGKEPIYENSHMNKEQHPMLKEVTSSLSM